MSGLRNLQADFFRHLLDDSEDRIVGQIESNRQCSAQQRMALYANAYVLRLKEAITTDYPCLQAYLGDEQFDHLMTLYIKQYPSQQTNLRYYSQHMVRLLEQTAPYTEYPELAEIALIEQVFANSFDAANCDPVSLDALSALAPSAWVGLALTFQDAVQLVPLRYNSFPLWRALSKEETLPEKVRDESTWLVWRQDLVSRYRGLQEAEATVLSAAMSGASFAEICTRLLAFYDENTTPVMAVGYLKNWIQDQMVKSLVITSVN